MSNTNANKVSIQQATDAAHAFFRDSEAWKRLKSNVNYTDWLKQQVFDDQLADNDSFGKAMIQYRSDLDWLEFETGMIQSSLPLEVSASKARALSDLLKEMFETSPGLIDALQNLGIDTQISAARGDLNEVCQGMHVLQQQFIALSLAYDESSNAQDAAESDHAIMQAENSTRLAFAENLLQAMGLSCEKASSELVDTVQKLVNNMKIGLFGKATLTALDEWLSWDGKNQTFPTPNEFPFPRNHRDLLLMSVEGKHNKFCYGGLHKMVRMMKYDQISANELRITACSALAALELICSEAQTTPDSLQLSYLFLCYRIIELLMRMTDLTDDGQKRPISMIFLKLNGLVNRSSQQCTLLTGIKAFLYSYLADNSAQSPAQSILDVAQNTLPYASSDNVILVVDGELVLALEKPFKMGSVRICSKEEVQVSFTEDWRYEMFFPTFGQKKEVANLHQQLYYRHFKVTWDNFFSRK